MSKLKLTGKSSILKKKKSGINKRELSLVMAEATKCGSGLNALKGYVSLPNFNSNSNENYGFYISDGELVVDSISNVKNQINSNCSGGGGQAPQALRLTFDDIANADLLVGDASSVEDWNTFFDLPTYGNPFTSVEVVGDEVRLFGGSNIIIKEMLFDQANNLGTHLLEVDDQAGCVIEIEYDAFGQDNYNGCQNLISVSFPNVTIIGDYGFNYAISLVNINLPQLTTAGSGCFGGCTSLTTINIPQLTSVDSGCFSGCTSLTTINLPQLTTAGSGCFYSCTSLTTINLPQLTSVGSVCFQGCTSLTTINLPQLTSVDSGCFGGCTSLTTINIPSCTDLGGTVGDDSVFFLINSNTITLTVPSILMTCNSGNPDGDIQYLQANNTVTIVTV